MSRVMTTRNESRNWRAFARLLSICCPRRRLFFADELDIHLLPKIGYEWMLRGTQTEVMTPGTNQKNYLAGALNYRDGQDAACRRRAQEPLACSLICCKLIDRRCPAAKFTTIYVVVDNYRIHKAKAVVAWLAAASALRVGVVAVVTARKPTRLSERLATCMTNARATTSGRGSLIWLVM